MAKSHLAPFMPGNAKNTILHLTAEALGIPVNNTPPMLNDFGGNMQQRIARDRINSNVLFKSAGDNPLHSMSLDRIPVPARKPVFTQPNSVPYARNSGTVRYVTPSAIEKIKEWEGPKTRAYRDQGDVWTIGYGHTGRSGGVVPYEGMVITSEQAEKLLADDLNVAAKDVQSLVKVPLNDNQYAALVAFFLNMGNKESTQKSTFLRQLNAGDYSAIEREFPKWVWYTDEKDKQKKQSDGLINRRNKEIQLWKTPVK